VSTVVSRLTAMRLLSLAVMAAIAILMGLAWWDVIAWTTTQWVTLPITIGGLVIIYWRGTADWSTALVAVSLVLVLVSRYLAR